MTVAAAAAPSSLDLVMVGDSLVEQWNGTGMFGSIPYPAIQPVFSGIFTKAGGGSLEGLALGSSGDQVSQSIPLLIFLVIETLALCHIFVTIALVV